MTTIIKAHLQEGNLATISNFPMGIYKINGQVKEITYTDLNLKTPFIIDVDSLKNIIRLVPQSITSHYLNLDNGETLSVSDYIFKKQQLIFNGTTAQAIK